MRNILCELACLMEPIKLLKQVKLGGNIYLRKLKNNNTLKIIIEYTNNKPTLYFSKIIW